MTSTRASTPHRRSPSPEETSELARAAADLEALADAYDECTRSLETLEATVDTLLDDASTCAIVLDHERRVRAVSRGMAALLDAEPSIVGSPATRWLPPDWPDLDTLLGGLTNDEGWRSLSAGDDGAVLHARRATAEDSAAVYVVRYLPPAD